MFLKYAQSLFRCNSSNFVIGASRGETHRRSALEDYLYHGLLVSLHWAISFLWLVRPPGLLASFVSCRVQNEDGFYRLVLLYVPAKCLWLYIMLDEKNLPWLFAV